MTAEETPVALPRIYGTEDATLDSKGRVLLSKKKRERLGADFVIAFGEVGCLVAYPSVRWEALVDEVLSSPATNLGRQQYSRLILGSAEDELNCDAQGRFVLPARLRERAGLAFGDGLLLVGAGDRMEIWSVTEYAKYEADPDGYGAARRDVIERAESKLRGVTR